jgi:hypothetical protein
MWSVDLCPNNNDESKAGFYYGLVVKETYVS